MAAGTAAGVAGLRRVLHRSVVVTLRAGVGAYDHPVVDNALLEQVLRLDDIARRELRDAIDDSLDGGEATPEIVVLIDERLASVAANPDDHISLDDFERELRATRIA